MYMNLLFSAVLLAFLIMMDLYAFKYPFEARIFPWIIGIPATIMMLGVMYKLIVRLRADQESLAKLKDINFRPHAVIIAWMLGYVIIIYLLGFYAASLLFVFLYLKIGGIGWSRSIWVSVGLAVAIYVLFTFGMEMTVYNGLIYDSYMDWVNQ